MLYDCCVIILGRLSTVFNYNCRDELSPAAQTWAVLPDFFLFPRLKSSLKGHHFGTVKNVQAAVTNALKEIPVQDFQTSYDA